MSAFTHTALTKDAWRQRLLAAHHAVSGTCFSRSVSGACAIERCPPLVCALPSPASAEGRPSLFGWFIGTTAQSGLLLHVHVRRSVYGLRGPVLIRRPRRAGDLPVLVHVVSQRARGS